MVSPVSSQTHVVNPSISANLATGRIRYYADKLAGQIVYIYAVA